MSDTTPGFVTVAAACRRIGISKPHGSKLVKAGKFPVELVPVGFRRMVRVVDLEKFCNPGAFAADPDAPIGVGRRDGRSIPVPAVQESSVVADPAISITKNDDGPGRQPRTDVDEPARLSAGKRRAS